MPSPSDDPAQRRVEAALDYERSAPRGSFEMLRIPPRSPGDYVHLFLNEIFEYKLSRILREDPDVAPVLLGWARNMAEAIPGYNTWHDAFEYTWESLREPVEVPGVGSSTLVGTEEDLVALLSPELSRRYDLRGFGAEHSRLGDEEEALALARQRIDVLDQYRLQRDRDEEFPARLYRKIYYTYKLREALLGQVGYYNGSLELRAGLRGDFEHWMYLIQLKIRRPDRQHLFKAPKSFRVYRTPPGSLMPWNNQFSYSFGFDEFPAGHIPRRVVRRMERSLARTARSDQLWLSLCRVLGWDSNDVTARAIRDQLASPPSGVGEPTWGESGRESFTPASLEALIQPLHADEVARKALYTLVLRLTWSDELMDPLQNPFRHAETSSLPGGHVLKDPRLPAGGAPPEEALANADRWYNVVGRKANVLLEPSTAAGVFRSQLEALAPRHLRSLYANIPDTRVTIDGVVEQAVGAAEAWRNHAVTARRPMFTGPSGHVVSYLTIYLEALHAGAIPEGYPTLEQARVVQAAALMGVNNHHTYDEVFIASVGLRHGAEVLRYDDRVGYRDLLSLPGPVGEKLRARAAEALKRIRDVALQNADGRTHFERRIHAWYRQAA